MDPTSLVHKRLYFEKAVQENHECEPEMLCRGHVRHHKEHHVLRCNEARRWKIPSPAKPGLTVFCKVKFAFKSLSQLTTCTTCLFLVCAFTWSFQEHTNSPFGHVARPRGPSSAVAPRQHANGVPQELPFGKLRRAPLARLCPQPSILLWLYTTSNK